MESRDDPKYAKLTHVASPGGYDKVSEETGVAAELEEVKHHIKYEMHKLHDKFDEHRPHWKHEDAAPGAPQPHPGAMSCQIVRSCARWSHGVPLQVRINKIRRTGPVC